MITRLLPQVSEPQTFRYKHGSSTFLSSGINWNLQKKSGKFSLLLQLQMTGKIGKENHTIWTKRIGNNPHISMEVRSREKLSNTKRWKWIRNSFPEGWWALILQRSILPWYHDNDQRKYHFHALDAQMTNGISISPGTRDICALHHVHQGAIGYCAKPIPEETCIIGIWVLRIVFKYSKFGGRGPYTRPLSVSSLIRTSASHTITARWPPSWSSNRKGSIWESYTTLGIEPRTFLYPGRFITIV